MQLSQPFLQAASITALSCKPQASQRFLQATAATALSCKRQASQRCPASCSCHNAFLQAASVAALSCRLQLPQRFAARRKRRSAFLQAAADAAHSRYRTVDHHTLALLLLCSASKITATALLCNQQGSSLYLKQPFAARIIHKPQAWVCTKPRAHNSASSADASLQYQLHSISAAVMHARESSGLPCTPRITCTAVRTQHTTLAADGASRLYACLGPSLKR